MVPHAMVPNPVMPDATVHDPMMHDLMMHDGRVGALHRCPNDQNCRGRDYRENSPAHVFSSPSTL
jgi:hypothetical protein